MAAREYNPTVRAAGTCSICRNTTTTRLGDAEDAPAFLLLEHGGKYGHCFEGEIIVEVVKPKRKLRHVA